MSVMWFWRGEVLSGDRLIEAMIEAGVAAPAARDMPVEETVRAVVDQLFLTFQEAPKPLPGGQTIPTYTEDGMEDRRNHHYPREWKF